MRKFSLLFIACILTLFMAGSASAATSVSWISPADGSTFDVGTIVNPQGQASGSGITGGTGLDLMLVIDTSGSMNYYGYIEPAKQAAIALVNALPDNTTQVGIVTFDAGANTYRQLQDLTSNKADLIAALNALTAPGYSTAIGDGINQATAQLTGPNAIAGHAKMQVVLSDGENLMGANPITAASAAAAAGITIHTVGFVGSSVTTMQNIASTTGGTFTYATDLSVLTAIFDGTGGNIVELDHVDIQLADGSWINNIATDGLGNFILPDQVIALGPNTFTAHAYGTDGSYASAVLTLNGTAAPVPEPALVLLLGSGLLGLAGFKRKISRK